ncbi:MAG TPA: YdiU family protein [Rhizomicrobium sp.]
MSQTDFKPKTQFAPGWVLEDHYGRLPPGFYTRLPPEAVGVDPTLVHANPAAAALIDLDPALFATPDFAQIFSGHAPLAGFAPLAMVYAGHQFGGFSAQLGDGRALLIAQLRNAKGELWDVQLKGAGLTPYSRFGDGRAVLRSCIREYLASEAMAALNIPTTRALAIIATHEGVQRETIEPGAVLTRLAQSHIRFGHFEYFHHTRRDAEAVRLLADHVIAEHFPALAGNHKAWFAEVVRRTAQMIADWQAVGFAHGVMNTDNMSILGLTMDYGPYGFLDAYEPHFICNHSDDSGRYAFDRQPAIGHWNLRALALALTTLVAEEDLIAGLNGYEPAFTERYNALMRAKLGLASHAPEDGALIGELLDVMARSRADYTNTFRLLSRVDTDEQAWLGLFIDHTEAKSWLEKYRARVEPDAPARMERVNPKYVLRNWIAETAIRAVQDKGDIATLDRIFRMLQKPFDDQPENDSFAAPPPESMRGLEVSCSS